MRLCSRDGSGPAKLLLSIILFILTENIRVSKKFLLGILKISYGRLYRRATKNEALGFLMEEVNIKPSTNLMILMLLHI